MMDDKSTAESLSGIVSKITYKNEHNGYTVLSLDTGDDIVTAVGNMPFVNEGDYINCSGNFVFHSNYGEQFKVEYFEKVVKSDTASLLRYLSSGSIKGIGPATARKIVEKFGDNTLDVIENSPQELCKIRGISLQKALLISEEYKKQFGLRDIVMAFSPFGVTPDRALKIFKRLGSNAQKIIKENPYVLCDDGIEFPFEQVEDIAAAYNIDMLCSERLTAGILYVLKKNSANAHTCLPFDKLCTVAASLLGCQTAVAEQMCEELGKSFKVVFEDIGGKCFVFLPEYYNAERYIAARVCSDLSLHPFSITVDELEIDRVENMLSIRFEALQRKAVSEAAENTMFILTGGPGTGKTTTLNAMINVFSYRNLNIILAAPTGRAAQRITELTGMEAKTIHRLLEVERSEDEKHVFMRNERNPLDCDVLIIDEMSMVDTLLFEGVLRALRPGCRIIMVGDVDQLPSVGAGNVFGDLLSSGIVPSVRLNTIFRQAEQSRIITNAHAIINGGKIDISNSRDSDFFFLGKSSAAECLSSLVELVTQRLPQAYGFSPEEDIQVLCPSRKTENGSLNLNFVLQDALNPSSSKSDELYFKGGFVRVGDKVMQIKNNYDIVWEKDGGDTGTGIFNGDIGTVCAVDRRSDSLTVIFDDKRVMYTREELSQLELAYAITVHKSQGSEFECVVMPVFDVPSQLRYRNLLYTAITRAKKMLILVGDKGVFRQMTENVRHTLRYTGMCHFIEKNESDHKTY